SLRSFHRQKQLIYLAIAGFISLITMVAAILFFVAAGEVKNTPGTFWSVAQSDFVNTGVLNMNAVFFFLGAIVLRSEPFGHAALFYLASFYIVPLLPALNQNSLNELVNPHNSTSDILNEDTFLAASGLGYAGVVAMALFLLHRFQYQAEHHDDDENLHPYDKINA
ncbi:MAG: hypothetical protein Q8P67_05015, partial [archaeon]|nr:hypothetical protein [archaeon]